MNNNLTFSSTGLLLLQKLEGLRLDAYPDSKGVPTIGFGHTHGVKLGDFCTFQQASEWLKEDLVWAQTAVNSHVVVPLNQNQFDALVIFTYNIGAAGFAGSELLSELNTRTPIAQLVPLFFHYITSGGKVVLISRRANEAQLFVKT